MALPLIIGKIEKDFEKFEIEIEKLSKHITLLAKNSVKNEIEQLKIIEKDRERINSLEQEINDKKLFTDVNVEGIGHLETNLKTLKKRLAKDERNFFFGNSLAHSAIGFEKQILKQIEEKAKFLHRFSTSIQIRINNAIEFAENELKGKIEINKHDLYKKSLSLAETNTKLLQNMIYLANIKLDSSDDVENYHNEKNRILSDVENMIDIEEYGLKEAAKTFSSYYLSDLHRTRAMKQ